MPAGFTLPAILVVVGALLILAVGVLLIVGIERNTARSFVDRQRAELAAKAGLEDIRGIFTSEAANDDFVVLQSTLADPISTATPPPDRAPQLFLARGKVESGKVAYRYVPLFSTISSVSGETSTLTLPPVDDKLVGASATSYIDFQTLPYLDKARASWLPVLDEKSNNKMVGRYAYWVEDLQSRVDAGTAGNTKGGAGEHLRYGWTEKDASATARFPAPGLNAEPSDLGSDGHDKNPPLDQVALYSLDSTSGAKDSSDLDKTIIDGRKALVTPDSVLAVAGVVPPLTRGNDGHLSDSKARMIEESLGASVQPYEEQALVPYASGIDPVIVGKERLNLNALLSKPAATAVDEMANWISKGLPAFESRKGGFPDNYLKTLAANALDYADLKNEATTSGNVVTGPSAYRGLDAYPLISEVVLHYKYQGVKTSKGRKVMFWQMLVFVELWNHTNLQVKGFFKVSYENRFRMPAIGADIARTFDDEDLLTDAVQVQPKLDKIGDKFWSSPLIADLAPNQYKFYNPITLNYAVDLGPSSTKIQTQFNIDELDFGASGISLMWENKEVDRSQKLLRGNIDPKYSKTDFITNIMKQDGYAHIPAHSFGFPGGALLNNMGDCRQSLYLRANDFPLSDNSYPGNISPNQRNIRNYTIYKNGTRQSLVYGRVLPSEWPDGGHNVSVKTSTLRQPSSSLSSDNYNPADINIFPDYKNSLEGDTTTFISNNGRFYSATELGRIYDPIMWVPTYDNSDSILTGTMPSDRSSWPSVEAGNKMDDPRNIYYGGGNTLRIGRPEHPKFDRKASSFPSEMPGTHAGRLLDLFHAGISRSASQADREGHLVRIEGNVNLNTATEDALRALAAGNLKADPRLGKTTSPAHSVDTAAPPVTSVEVPALTETKQADLLAQAIIRGRPYSSPSEIATSRDVNGKIAFGNPLLYPDFKVPGKANMTSLEWSDAAAEEAFARVYNSATVRSRNFRIWVVGQAVSSTNSSNSSPEVLSEVRKVYTVFVDPGKRNSDGSINSAEFKISILHENDF